MQPKFTRGGCLYMGWSDVSEFEHIYGQIFTTPSCVYDRLFTWTWMVDLNELIVWKTLIDINFFCFSIKSSLWALIAAYTKFRRMIWSIIWSCGHRSRSPTCTVTSSKRRETTGEKLKAYNFVISGWVKPLHVLKRNFGYDSHDATSPFLNFPPSSLRLLPLHLINEGLGYHHGKIVEIKIEHFDGLMRLIIFLWNKKVNSPAQFLNFLSPENFRDAFCVAGGAFGRPW